MTPSGPLPAGNVGANRRGTRATSAMMAAPSSSGSATRKDTSPVRCGRRRSRQANARPARIVATAAAG
jgi:hypothetical protein